MAKNKYIETPEILWQHFLDYKKHVKSNPILVKDWVGKDADEVHKEKEKPLTFIGFQNWLDDADIISDVTDYFENKESRYTEYVRICSRIKRNIQDDQITGGMVNIYNPSITQRLNNLVERTDIKSDDKPIQSTAIEVSIKRPNEDED